MRLRRIEPVLRRALRGPCTLPAGARVLVALSGGADSTALLLGLRGIAHEFGLEVCAAHLHHGLRGVAADGDQAFARDLCAARGIPFHTERWDARGRMRRRGLAGQAGLRSLRRAFLAGAARRFEAAAIATAHTADDQLETLLMRLGRGTGLRGLGGMHPRRGAWLKPLLAAPRADVEADLNAIGQPWREDASNGDPAYLRSRIRAGAVAVLVAALDPDVAPAHGRARLARNAARAAAEARAAETALARWVRPEIGLARQGRGSAVTLDPARLRAYPPAARRAILGGVWRDLAPPGVGLTASRLDSLARLVSSSRPGALVELPAGFVAVRTGPLVRIGLRAPQAGGPLRNRR